MEVECRKLQKCCGADPFYTEHWDVALPVDVVDKIKSRADAYFGCSCCGAEWVTDRFGNILWEQTAEPCFD